jgi:formylglycine-generating enzyme required for sulfatase activity
VTWQEAYDYCRKHGKRLPTEAEWEYAARERGKKVIFGTGTDKITSNMANFNSTRRFWEPYYSEIGKYRKSPTPVGSFEPNANRLHDMSGNVWEWVSDWYDKQYYGKSPKDNPEGPESGEYKVLRGGSWVNGPKEARTTNRRPGNPERGYRDIGFRCARYP